MQVVDEVAAHRQLGDSILTRSFVSPLTSTDRRRGGPGNTTFLEWADAWRGRNVVAMTEGAHTPEELEDALVPRTTEIAQSASALWARDLAYVADPRRVIQAHDLALVLATHATSVVRHGDHGAWRHAIALLSIDHVKEK